MGSLSDIGGEMLREPVGAALVRDAIDRGSRSFVPPDASDHIDPLERLFNPAFTETLWDYEGSKIGPIPGVLHPKQIEALHNTAKHRWLFWGNQVGKTTIGAIDLAMKALGRHPHQLDGRKRMPPWTGWASALTWELWEKILLPELLTWIPPWRIIDAPPPFRQSTKRDLVIRADNGRISRITGKAAEQGAERYQSARIDDAWLDEEHPEAVWDELQPRLLRHGGDTLGTMTPLKGMGTFVYMRIYEPLQTGKTEVSRHWYSHAGLRDNPSITPEARAEMLAELAHNPAQLAARDEGKFVRPMGAVLPWDPEKHQTEAPFSPKDLTDGQLHWMLSRHAQWYGALDLGKWRFAFQFGVADHESYFTLVDEYFSQNESVDVRARGIHELLRSWHVPDTIMIPADCADPNGIVELNAAFERIGSPYSVFPIEGNLKNKAAGISRFESMLNRGAFKVRRGMGADHHWRLGADASKPGKPVTGSRWMWEAAFWQYPKMADGKIQKDEPDDTTADGADMMDGARYLVMKFFAAEPLPVVRKHSTLKERLNKEFERLDRMEEEAHEGGDRWGGVMRQG